MIPNRGVELFAGVSDEVCLTTRHTPRPGYRTKVVAKLPDRRSGQRGPADAPEAVV